MAKESAKTIVFSKKGEAGLGAVFRDLVTGFAKWRIWTSFAGEEIRNRYQGSILGVAWQGISFLIFVLAIALYFRALTGDALMYVAIGMATYQYIVGNLSDGCNVFVQARGWIQNAHLPFSIYVYKSMARSIVPLIISLVLCAGIAAFTRWVPPTFSWSPFLAMLVILLNAVWVHFLFGILNARFRDFGHLVAAVSRLLFFTSPILWDYNATAGLRRIVSDLNPLTHFIQVFRMPLLGEADSVFHWSIVLSITVAGWIATIIAMSMFRHRLARWVE
ncbi:MAG: ABC transporter permease [Henriciella sp.]